jgi:hypothetical protein
VIRVAQFYSKFPHEVAEQLPYPWYLATLQYMRDEWDEPSRADTYVMQLSAVLTGKTDIDLFRLKFHGEDGDGGEDGELFDTVEESKTKVMAALGGRFEVRVLPASEVMEWDPPEWTEEGIVDGDD